MPLRDDPWMTVALSLARTAAARGEVPVGACIVREGQLVSTGYNRREERHSVLAHAELEAIAEASHRLGRWRLSDCRLVVTLEPCPMCAGAALQARLGGVVFGAWDPSAGAMGSLYDLADDERMNHRIPVVPGVRETECSQLLREFFRSRR